MTDKDQKILYSDIGNNIRKLRLDKGFSQDKFAKLLDLTRASIVNIENGRQRPTIHLLFDICKITDSEISQILPGTKTEVELLPKWQKKIESSSHGDIIRDPKLTDFLIAVTSKKQQ